MKPVPVMMLLALTIPAAVAWTSANRPENSPLTVAVVDLGKLIKANPDYLSAESQIDEWRESQQAQLDTETKELESRRAELDSYRPGTEEFEQLLEDLEVMKFLLDRRVSLLNDQLDKRRAAALAAGYKTVESAVEQVRQERGIGIVMQYNPNAIAGMKREIVAAEIVPRAVLAFSDQLDITEAVLSILKGQ